MAGDTPREKRKVLDYDPDIGFQRKPISGDGGMGAEDAVESVQKRKIDRTKQNRRRRLERLVSAEKRLDTVEARIEDLLKDMKITFDPTERPRLADAVDVLTREKGPSYVGAQAAADQQAANYIDFPTYKRALTLSLDAMLHTYGVDPVNYVFSQTDESGRPMVPKPQGKPANCQEMADMVYVNSSSEAELAPIDTVIEQMQQSTLLDIMTLLWKLILYFVYGFIIDFCKKLRLKKIPFGIGKKVKKFVKKLKKRRAEILCQITGDCSELEDAEDPGPDYEGFGEMDEIGDEFWAGVECLTAAKAVIDFVHQTTATSTQNQANTNLSGSGGSTTDGGSTTSGGDAAGRLDMIPLYITVKKVRDKMEAVKFNTIMDVPSSEEDLQPLIDNLEEGTRGRARYRNRYFNRNAQAWRNLR